MLYLQIRHGGVAHAHFGSKSFLLQHISVPNSSVFLGWIAREEPLSACEPQHRRVCSLKTRQNLLVYYGHSCLFPLFPERTSHSAPVRHPDPVPSPRFTSRNPDPDRSVCLTARRPSPLGSASSAIMRARSCPPRRGGAAVRRFPR